ncbi:unnamed protein product [Lepeophtheirus salmonis]|uniref:RNA-directed DNA polymerase n=1 Tax=Lepeophtheirus salmonis TaxID=72036 RepID=A0A817F9S7_LEPSM|nr:unnamed protein product [Lepeophtheirus salmonis]CAG9475748.1 unnamed protein product [Lepeophtheirus salmonis]
MKPKVHAGHLGINSSLRRARELIYWPRMSSEIRQFIKACTTCAAYADCHRNEPLYMHEVPQIPWQKVGSDLFSYKEKQDMVMSEYLNRFFEIDLIPTSDSKTVIGKLKNHFTCYGIPDTLISNWGPQYTSSVFKVFQK